MRKLNFAFSTKLTFDNYVHDHSIALRCIPPETETQHILCCELEISPLVSTERTIDAFGNCVTSGYLKKEHRFLDFEVRGYAEIDCTKPRRDFMPCYRYQSPLTKPGDGIRAFYDSIKDSCTGTTPVERAAFFSEKLYNEMSYVRDSTTVTTTAEEAFAQKKGVCQDYTHILLSLLRLDGIPCRYIAGLSSCDGETHSWAEYWTAYGWRGIDPTNNCPTSDYYLVLSQGRDYSDCAIDRGVMLGAYTRQLQLISSNLSEEAY
ncbi:MAG: transglutaminase domain-containing protein [Oscillospiraceae bacterium]